MILGRIWKEWHICHKILTTQKKILENTRGWDINQWSWNILYIVNVDKIFYKYPDIIQLCSLRGGCKCCLYSIEFSPSTFPREKRQRGSGPQTGVMQILINRFKALATLNKVSETALSKFSKPLKMFRTGSNGLILSLSPCIQTAFSSTSL